jgi:hypothetical protein
LGGYQGITDLASLYAEGLLKVYPTAKVILCWREPDKWAESVDDTFVALLNGWVGTGVRRWAEPLAGTWYFTQLWDLLRAWFEVENATEMRRVYKERFESHYEMVRRMVPKEQLLEYRLGEGWGPLCEFLGKPVPDGPFPRVNDGKSLRVLLRTGMAITVAKAMWAVLRYPIMAVVMWYLTKGVEPVWKSYT